MLVLLTCLLLSTTVVYGASIIKSAYFNETLKLAINNSQADVKFITVELEGEQYGRNYVSVADFIKALNDNAGLNATVDFDSKTQTIVIDSKKAATSTTAATSYPAKISEPIKTPDNILVDVIDGVKLVQVGYINNRYFDGKMVSYFIGDNLKSGIYCLYKFDPEMQSNCGISKTLIENVPLKKISNTYNSETSGKQSTSTTHYLEYDYYVNTILPLIKKGAI